MKLMPRVFSALAFAFLTTTLHAAEALQVTQAWVPEAPPVANVMAGYMSVHNPGKQDVTIRAARSEGFASVEMHETRMQNGMAKMVRQDKLVIPAGKTVQFERGGLHLMLMQPKNSYKVGDSIPVTLDTSAGELKFNASVKAASLDDEKHDHHHHHH